MAILNRIIIAFINFGCTAKAQSDLSTVSYVDLSQYAGELE